ncbi:dialkylrecorsinol condensing enzyme [Rhodoferax saidenbachensis]|uniref:Dialkylrecorsinol condensing enzyme n=1 Tax=Rhodoferax saidenbachensis TaxID=1484693 RepID=A0ABU1ZKL0_9BURK|nr:dialkylrecorsinol condensing enzyme [Rhodoferax saidenbachensis]MDR7306084.1 hypothetical protein [Rhodoferax saidenbachensis]
MKSVDSNTHKHHEEYNANAAPRVKRVLVVCYSQSGQLTRIAERILAPLRESGDVEVQVEILCPRQPYPFPWTVFSFFDAFPESAHMVAPALEPLTLRGDEVFDLVILPYQVWFLAPSLPVTAFLKDPRVQRVLKGTPVVTVIACRNMWMLAQEKMKQMLADCGARLIDNVVLTDPSPTLLTLVTTPYWLFTGRKRLLGLPAAGIDDRSVAQAERFGRALRDGLHRNAEREPGPMLHGLKACVVDPRLYLSERAGTRSFYLWGLLLRAAGKPQSLGRKPLLVLYAVFLVLLILSVIPLSLLVQATLRPLLTRQSVAVKLRFEMPSGSGQERMGMYDC